MYLHAGEGVAELKLSFAGWVAKKTAISDDLLFPYPHPKSLGLILNPKEKARVLKVETGSDAAKAGFQQGDVIRTLAGQPLLSIADVQWVLHHTPSVASTIKAEVTRAGKPMEVSLKLSKGWRQRAWLAQAIIHDPPVLILDEPTDGLDPAQKSELRVFLREAAKSKAILMSTHILEEAEALCDRIVVIAGGRVAGDAPLREFCSPDGRLTVAWDQFAAPL